MQRAFGKGISIEVSAPLSTHSPVDPEMLRGRVLAMPDVEHRQQVLSVIDRCYACLGKFHCIDFVSLEREIPNVRPRELWRMVEESLAKIWLSSEELLAALQPLNHAHQARVDEGDAEVSDEDSFSLEGNTSSAPMPTTPVERIAETAWAMAFVLSGEIDSFRKRHGALLAGADGWELVSAIQDHLGHLSSAIHAIVTGIYASLPSRSGEEAVDEQTLELVSSQALRHGVFALRDGVLALEQSLTERSSSEWQPILEEVSRLVEEFVFSTAFAWMRAGDKRAFLNHRHELAELLALWSPLRSAPAKRLVGALARHLEALEVLNQRECLVEHDKDVLRHIIRNLQEASQLSAGLARENIAKALAGLAKIQGRDSELDVLLATTLDPCQAVPHEAILARAERVLAQLGG